MNGSRYIVLRKGPGAPTSLVRAGRVRGTRAGEVRVPNSGRMRVVLNIHGGQQGLADVIDGLVDRNARAVEQGLAPAFSEEAVENRGGIDPAAKAWRDAPAAAKDRYLSGRSAAAWYAGTLRAQGERVRLGFRSGQPAVYALGDGRATLLRVFEGPGVGDLGVSEGRTDERMLVTIDDDSALPVQEINTAIARHNARRIKSQNLPPLYKSGVRYKTEGSPELWWDAEEILRNGHDDCEGLAAYRAGELINRGYDARVYTRLVQQPSKEMGGSGKKGGRLFHAVTKVYAGPDGAPVLAADGTPVYDDPSARLGMPTPAWYLKFAREMRAQGKDL